MDISDSFIQRLLKLHKEVSACPPPARIIRFFDSLLGTIFPEFSENRLTDEESIKRRLIELKSEFRTILNQNEECVQSKKTSIEDLIFDELPDMLENAGIYYDDITPELSQRINTDYDAIRIFEDTHPNAAGAALIGELLWERSGPSIITRYDETSP